MRKIRAFWETSTTTQRSIHIQEELVPSSHPVWGTSLQWGSDGSPFWRIFASLKGWGALLITHPGEEVEHLILKPQNFGHVKSMTVSCPIVTQTRVHANAPDLQLYYM